MQDIRFDVNKFQNEVEAYEAETIHEGMILFYGDSAFTRWSEKYGNHNLADDIRGKDGSLAAVSHGLGGSNSDQLLYWYRRMVLPWKPRALVLKAYGNDSDRAYTPAEIVFLQSRIFEWARCDMPGIKIYVTDAQVELKNRGIKQLQYYHRQEYNERIAEYCKRHDDVKLVQHAMWPEFFETPEGVGDYSKVRAEIFIEDQVHFNKEGYEIYKRFWLDALDDIL